MSLTTSKKTRIPKMQITADTRTRRDIGSQPKHRSIKDSIKSPLTCTNHVEQSNEQDTTEREVDKNLYHQREHSEETTEKTKDSGKTLNEGLKIMYHNINLPKGLSIQFL